MGARFLSSTGLGSGNLIGRAQFPPAPALDKIGLPQMLTEKHHMKEPTKIDTVWASCPLILGPGGVERVTCAVHASNEVYTAGVVLPRPVSECRYYHRSLNPKKLIEVRVAYSGWLQERPQELGLSRALGSGRCSHVISAFHRWNHGSALDLVPALAWMQITSRLKGSKWLLSEHRLLQAGFIDVQDPVAL